ncbi:MAG: hypothetical protein Q8O41_01135 [Candidatus Methanoperedens sp.]|nr:hypothetical protein [Candidatus Methanoperedens sp.]
MGEKYLGDLLEELDEVSYSRTRSILKPKRTVGYLEKIIPLGLILEAFSRDLIRDANEPEKLKTFGRTIDKTIPCTLTITGFQYLNQIRIKKSIEELNDSINKFSERSDGAYSKLNDSIIKSSELNDKVYHQLNDSIKRFNESSDRAAKRLEWLTVGLTAFTVLLVCLTVIEMFLREQPLWVKFVFIISAYGLIIIISIVYWYLFIKRK